MENCIFCKIVKGEIPAHKVYEDENFLAFLDLRPINPGHTLVIPKKHEEYLFDLADGAYSALLLKSKELAKAMKEKLQSPKIGMVVEGFGVPHVHVHLIPIVGPNELDPDRAQQASPEELKAMAELLKTP